MRVGTSDADRRLVFIYPIVIDNSLREHATLLRDFISVSFISAIKMENYIKISAEATTIQRPEALTPAQQLNQYLSGVAGQTDQRSQQNQPTQTHNIDYQAQINKYYNFIKNQIEHDPRYSDLRPMFSSIDMTKSKSDNQYFLEMPLIVGTRSYTVPAISVYWLLLVSFLKNIPLDRSGNITRISNMVSNLTPDNYRSFLLINDGVTNIASGAYGRANISRLEQIAALPPTAKSSRHTQVMSAVSRQINDQSVVAARTLNRVVDPALWDRETGGVINTPQTMMNNIMTSTAMQRSTGYQEAVSVFDSNLANFILPSVYSYYTILESTPGLGIRRLVEWYTDEIQRVINDSEFSVGVVGESFANYSNLIQSEGSDIAETADRIESIVKRLSSLNVQSLYRDAWGRSLVSPVGAAFTRADVVNFLKQDENLTAQIVGFIKNLEDGLHSINSRATMMLRSRLRAEFRSLTHRLVFGPTPSGLGQLYYEYPQNQHSRLTSLYNTQNINDVLAEISHNAVDSIASQLYFFYLYSLINMLSSYIVDVKIKIKATEKDLMDFPNYTLVVPLDYLQGLWYARASTSFGSSINTNDNKSFSFNTAVQNNVNVLINNVVETLGVPNIIVIDSKTNTVYYRFINQKFPSKITMSALKSYVTHQSRVLPAF